MVLRSPRAAVLQDVYVSPGQTVAANTALFEVASLDPLWVRVPVYVGEVDKIDPQAPARVRRLGGRAGEPGLPARRVSAPLRADPGAATADLFFELANPNEMFRPGERVRVTLAMKVRDESLVVPWSAVVYDLQFSRPPGIGARVAGFRSVAAADGRRRQM